MIALHTRIRIGPTKLEEEINALPDHKRRFVKSIMIIDGVETITTLPYEIVIGKGRLFDWEPIKRGVEGFYRTMMEEQARFERAG